MIFCVGSRFKFLAMNRLNFKTMIPAFHADVINAGWSCLTGTNAIQHFADKIVAVINQYTLYGWYP